MGSGDQLWLTRDVEDRHVRKNKNSPLVGKTDSWDLAVGHRSDLAALRDTEDCERMTRGGETEQWKTRGDLSPWHRMKWR
jgi:hypothetical protein